MMEVWRPIVVLNLKLVEHCSNDRTSWRKAIFSCDVACGHHAYLPYSLPSILPTTQETSYSHRPQLNSNSLPPISHVFVYGLADLTWRRGRRIPGRGFPQTLLPSVLRDRPLMFLLAAEYQTEPPIVGTVRGKCNSQRSTTTTTVVAGL
jgi:hypothetical protein